MIRRKDSFGYIDFVRGKYSLKEPVNIITRIDEMSTDEKSRLESSDFPPLWNALWGEASSSTRYRSDEAGAHRKFELLKLGLLATDQSWMSLSSLLAKSQTTWNETEWEFPKGRRNYQEKDIDCAIREFGEETGYDPSLVTVMENVLPYEEVFIGSNGKSYKNKYFIGFMNEFDTSAVHVNYQQTEVSMVQWKSLDECINTIRPYNKEKINVIQSVGKLISATVKCDLLSEF